MAILDTEFGTNPAPVEGGGIQLSLPLAAPAFEPLDWACLLEEAQARVREERARAHAAELRREELSRSESDARALVRSLARQLDICRFKLRLAPEQTSMQVTKVLERRVESQDAEIAELQLMLRGSEEQREQLKARQRDETDRLRRDLDRERSRIAKVDRKGERVAETLRERFDRLRAAAKRRVEAREGTIARLRERNAQMRAALARATALFASLRKN